MILPEEEYEDYLNTYQHFLLYLGYSHGIISHEMDYYEFEFESNTVKYECYSKYMDVVKLLRLYAVTYNFSIQKSKDPEW